MTYDTTPFGITSPSDALPHPPVMDGSEEAAEQEFGRLVILALVALLALLTPLIVRVLP